MRHDSVPPELRSYDQWILWKLVERDGKATKVPCDATGKPVPVNDPTSWLTFEQAVEQASTRDLGIGFCFTEADPFIGIDLDACLPLAGDGAEILGRIKTYAEISPSGTGVKLIGKGDWPADARNRTREVEGFGQIEVYDRDRFFTITGNQFGLCGEISYIDTEWLVSRFLPAQEDPVTLRTVEGASSLRERAQGFAAEDEELIEFLREDLKYDALWEGDCSDYGDDQSAADLALLEKIAWLAGPFPDRIERIFSQSALAARTKWDRPDYRERSIAKALEGKDDFYNGPGHAPTMEAADLPRDGDADVTEAAAEADVVSGGAFPIPERGIIRDVVDLVGPLTESPDATIALGTLILLSSVAGWGRVSKWGESEEPCILYACICGPSASGRKTTGLRNVESIFHEAFSKDELKLENVGHASGRALLEIAIGGIDIFYGKLKEPSHDTPQTIELEDGSTVKHPDWEAYDDLKTARDLKLENPPSVVLIWDEMAKLLSVDGDWQRDTRTELLRMYNGKHSGIRTTGKDGLKVPGGKCQMAFLGTMVTADLVRGLNSMQANDGFVGRILFSPDSNEEKPLFAFPPDEPLDYAARKARIKVKLDRFRERCSTARNVFPHNSGGREGTPWSPEAYACREAWYKAGKARANMDLVLFDRVQATAAKIACLLALAEDSDTIELHHVELAQQMADASIEVSVSAVEKAIESQRDRYTDAVYTALRDGALPLSKVLERGMLGAAEPGERLPERELRELWLKKDPRIVVEKNEGRGGGSRVERAE